MSPLAATFLEILKDTLSDSQLADIAKAAPDGAHRYSGDVDEAMKEALERCGIDIDPGEEWIEKWDAAMTEVLSYLSDSR